MAQLTPDQFSAKWIPLLANNVFQDIDGVRLGQLVVDIKDSFGVTASVNVPDWFAGTYYPLGYLILHSFGGPGIFLKALQAGYLPVPSDPLGDPNWAPALGPVMASTYQVGTVPALQGVRGDWVPGRLYILQNRLDAQGAALPDMYVRALSSTELEPEGYTIDALGTPPAPVRVQYELVTDATTPVVLASSFADLLGQPTDNAALAAALAPRPVAVGSGRRVSFEQERHWPLISTGTYVLDPAGAVVDVCFQLILDVGCTELSVPAGFAKLNNTGWSATKRNVYSFLVGVDGVIQYYLNQPA